MKAATFIPGRILMGFQSGELEPVCTAALVIRGLWEETHDASGGAKENRGCAADEVGESEAGLIRKKVPMTIALLGSPSALVIHSRHERLIVYLVRMDFVSK